MSKFRCDFYVSEESREGPNAPTPDDTKWSSVDQSSLQAARETYTNWQTHGGCKTCRLVEVNPDGTIHVIDQSNQGWLAVGAQQAAPLTDECRCGHEPSEHLSGRADCMRIDCDCTKYVDASPAPLYRIDYLDSEESLESFEADQNHPDAIWCPDMTGSLDELRRMGEVWKNEPDCYQTWRIVEVDPEGYHHAVDNVVRVVTDSAREYHPF